MAKQEVPRIRSGTVVGQVDATQTPRFAGISTFALLPTLAEIEEAQVCIVGIPFEIGRAHV